MESNFSCLSSAAFFFLFFCSGNFFLLKPDAVTKYVVSSLPVMEDTRKDSDSSLGEREKRTRERENKREEVTERKNVTEVNEA